MSHHIRRNAVAYLALFIALSGTSYAAVSLPKASVGPTQLKKNAVTPSKIRKNAITSAKVRDGSLRARDFDKNSLPAGKTGKTGPAGSRGATGPAGAPGPSTRGGITASDADATPLPVSGPTFVSHALTTPALGDLFVYGHTYVTMNCTPGPATAKAGAYVDGVPVPGTGRVFTAGTATRLDFTGVVKGIGVGAHTVRLAADCVTGTRTTTTHTESTIGGAWLTP